MSGKKSIRQRIAASMRGGRHQDNEPKESEFGDIVLLGMSKVGKTAIAERFINNYFSEQYNPTDSQKIYEVNALLDTEKDTTKDKKNMVKMKSFKKSVMGKSRTPLQSKDTRKVKSVLSVRGPSGGAPPPELGRAYQEGLEKGLKKLKFNLIDTPPDMMDMEPTAYRATIGNAKGFLLVCSFDMMEESLSYVEDRYNEIKKSRLGVDTPIIIVANKHDIIQDHVEGHAMDQEVCSKATELGVTWCRSSMAEDGGCDDLSEVMLNEVNIAAEHEEYQDSIPRWEYNYFDEQVEDDELDGY